MGRTVSMIITGAYTEMFPVEGGLCFQRVCAQNQLGPKKTLGTIDFTDPGRRGGCAPTAPPVYAL